jgi:hypothetical protein
MIYFSDPESGLNYGGGDDLFCLRWKERFQMFSTFLLWVSDEYFRKYSVADPGCLSRIPDPDPDPTILVSRVPGSGSDRLLSRIPDPDPGSYK